MFQKPSVLHTASCGQLEGSLHQVTHHLQTDLYTDLSRCGNGDVVGYHAVILASSSPLLRKVLEDPSRAGGPPEILMMDFTMEEVNNLLDLLHTGTAENNNSLRDLVNIFLIEADKKVLIRINRKRQIIIGSRKKMINLISLVLFLVMTRTMKVMVNLLKTIPDIKRVGKNQRIVARA